MVKERDFFQDLQTDCLGHRPASRRISDRKTRAEALRESPWICVSQFPLERNTPECCKRRRGCRIRGANRIGNFSLQASTKYPKCSSIPSRVVSSSDALCVARYLSRKLTERVSVVNRSSGLAVKLNEVDDT